jgi:hypothetical protein
VELNAVLMLGKSFEAEQKLMRKFKSIFSVVSEFLEKFILLSSFFKYLRDKQSFNNDRKIFLKKLANIFRLAPWFHELGLATMASCIRS